MRRVAVLLLSASFLLCAAGAYTVVQSAGFFPLPPPSLGLFLRLVLYLLVMSCGATVIYAANTLPEDRVLKFTRFGTGFEIAGARWAYTVLGIAMIALSYLWLENLFDVP